MLHVPAVAFKCYLQVIISVASHNKLPFQDLQTVPPPTSSPSSVCCFFKLCGAVLKKKFLFSQQLLETVLKNVR